MRSAVLITSLLWLTALGLGAWALSQLPLDTISHSIAALTSLQWIMWGAINLAIILLLCGRWHLLNLAFEARIPLWRLLVFRQAGQAISFITPGPQFGGEPLQLYWLYRYGLPLRRALLSLGLDRFLELWINLSILLCAALILLALATGDQHVISWKNALIPATVFLGVMGLLAWILLAQPNWFNQRIEQLAQRWQHHPRLHGIHQQWQLLNEDLRRALRTQRRRLFTSVVISLLAWVGLLGELWLLLSFVNLDISLHNFLLILIAMRMALLLPMPGGVGTLEASVLWSFHAVNLPTEAAVGLIALMRLRDATVLLLGLVCLAAAKKAGDTPPNRSHFPKV